MFKIKMNTLPILNINLFEICMISQIKFIQNSNKFYKKRIDFTTSCYKKYHFNKIKSKIAKLYDRMLKKINIGKCTASDRDSQ